jgi:hypothetical protein
MILLLSKLEDMIAFENINEGWLTITGVGPHGSIELIIKIINSFKISHYLGVSDRSTTTSLICSCGGISGVCERIMPIIESPLTSS